MIGKSFCHFQVFSVPIYVFHYSLLPQWLYVASQIKDFVVLTPSGRDPTNLEALGLTGVYSLRSLPTSSVEYSSIRWGTIHPPIFGKFLIQFQCKMRWQRMSIVNIRHETWWMFFQSWRANPRKNCSVKNALPPWKPPPGKTRHKITPEKRENKKAKKEKTSINAFNLTFFIVLHSIQEDIKTSFYVNKIKKGEIVEVSGKI